MAFAIDFVSIMLLNSIGWTLFCAEAVVMASGDPPNFCGARLTRYNVASHIFPPIRLPFTKAICAIITIWFQFNEVDFTYTEMAGAVGSNLRYTIPKTDALPLGHAPIRSLAAI